MKVLEEIGKSKENKRAVQGNTMILNCEAELIFKNEIEDEA